MMGSGFQDCIVAVFDLVGIKKLAPDGTGGKQMRRLHDVVLHAAGDGFDCITRAYTWNDSVLLLAYVNNHQDGYACVLREFSRLKSRIDQVSESYGVVVKGKSLPSPQCPSTSQDDRFVFIEASSYAMANCMDIPGRFKNNHHEWYLDERVSQKLVGLLARPASQLKVPLLPTGEERYIYAYDKLWLDDDQGGVSQDAAPVPPDRSLTMGAWMARAGPVLMLSSVLMLVLGLLIPEEWGGIYGALLMVVFFSGLGLGIAGEFFDPERRRIQVAEWREFAEVIRDFGLLINDGFYGAIRGAGAIWRRVLHEWRGGT